MRLVFAGTPAVAVPALDALVSAGHEVLAVVTRPDAPLGRKRVLTPSPVAARADQLGLTVIRAARLGEEQARQIDALGPELGVVVAYGGLVREPLLSAPAHGWINLHFSLLPAWRGAAPAQRAIMAGDAQTGITVFQLEQGLDTGPVHRARPVPIGASETAGELLERLAREGAPDVLAAIEAIGRGERPAPQRGEVSHAAKLTAEDGVVDWTRPAAEVSARIRGVTPEPGAVTSFAGERVKVLRIAPARPDDPPLAPGELRLAGKRLLAGTGDAPLELAEVQPSGRKPMRGADWARGRAEIDGGRLA